MNKEIDEKQEELDSLAYKITNLEAEKRGLEELLAEVCFHTSMIKISENDVRCRLCDKQLPLQMFIDF
jgi:chromosome segregation ATPase